MWTFWLTMEYLDVTWDSKPKGFVWYDLSSALLEMKFHDDCPNNEVPSYANHQPIIITISQVLLISAKKYTILSVIVRAQ